MFERSSVLMRISLIHEGGVKSFRPDIKMLPAGLIYDLYSKVLHLTTTYINFEADCSASVDSTPKDSLMIEDSWWHNWDYRMSTERIRNNSYEHLSMEELTSMWLPYLLKADKKLTRKTVPIKNLALYYRNLRELLRQIITVLVEKKLNSTWQRICPFVHSLLWLKSTSRILRPTRFDPHRLSSVS